MSLAQDKRQQRTIEGIFKKVSQSSLSVLSWLSSWTRTGRGASHCTTTSACSSLTASRWLSRRPGGSSGWRGTTGCSPRRTSLKLSRARTSSSRASTRTMMGRWRRWLRSSLSDHVVSLIADGHHDEGGAGLRGSGQEQEGLHHCQGEQPESQIDYET